MKLFRKKNKYYKKHTIQEIEPYKTTDYNDSISLPENCLFKISTFLFNIKEPENCNNESITYLLDMLKIIEKLAIFKKKYNSMKNIIEAKVLSLSEIYLNGTIYKSQINNLDFYEKILRIMGGKHVLQTLIFKILNLDINNTEHILDLISIYYHFIKNIKHKSIFKSKKNINFTDKDGKTIIHYIHCFQPSLTLKLLEYDIDINIQDNKGRTALHYASDAKNIIILLENKANTKLKTKRGDSPLHYWINNSNNIERITALINGGYDINSKNKYGATPLHVIDEPEACQTLLSLGAKVNLKNKEGSTPLHDIHSSEKTRILLSWNANVNAVDKCGNTPLHLIKINKYYGICCSFMPDREKEKREIAKFLILNNADTEKKNKRGNIPQIIRECPDFVESVLR